MVVALLLLRLGFVRQKFTTCKQPLSPGYKKEVGFTFHQQIVQFFSAYNIPDNHKHISNSSPTFCCCLKWYLDTERRYTSIDQKLLRQMIGKFAISMCGIVKMSSKLYFSKSHTHSKLLVKTKKNQKSLSQMFWSLHYNKNQWFKVKRRESQEWLLISDVFKGHWMDLKNWFYLVITEWFPSLEILQTSFSLLIWLSIKRANVKLKHKFKIVLNHFILSGLQSLW